MGKLETEIKFLAYRYNLEIIEGGGEEGRGHVSLPNVSIIF